MEDEVKLQAKDFEKVKVLGEGGFGKVFLVFKVSGEDYGRVYALKQVKKTEDHKRMDLFYNELQVLKRVRGHRFLPTLQYAYETASHLNFVLDFVNGGDLFSHVSRRGSLCESCVKFYVGELVLALRYLHKRKIVHRDVKPENILLDSCGHLILTDFGFSEFLSSGQIPSSKSCGTLRYMAPESIQPSYDKGHGYAVDWWALGVVTYELLTGHTPFTSYEDEISYESIISGILWSSPSYPSTFSEEVTDFIHSLLNKDSSQRLGSNGAKHVKKHLFFKAINWHDLEKKKVPVPFIPFVKGDLDVTNFLEKFTNIPVNEEMEDGSQLCACDPDTLSCVIHSSHKLFKDFFYVAPASRKTKKWTESLSPQQRPCTSELCGSCLSATRSSLGSRGFSVTKCCEWEMGVDVSPSQVPMVNHRRPTTRKRSRSSRDRSRPSRDLTEAFRVCQTIKPVSNSNTAFFSVSTDSNALLEGMMSGGFTVTQTLTDSPVNKRRRVRKS